MWSYRSLYLEWEEYFLTFQDDYIHYTFVYLLENKLEVQEILKEFVKRVEAHYNLKVSKIKSNGRDILIKIFKYGIKIEE